MKKKKIEFYFIPYKKKFLINNEKWLFDFKKDDYFFGKKLYIFGLLGMRIHIIT